MSAHTPGPWRIERETRGGIAVHATREMILVTGAERGLI